MSTSKAGTSVFFNPHRPGFGQVTEADERMHWDACTEIDDPALIETQFLGFNVPEHDIAVFTYLRAHPNLKLLSSGVWGWQGVKPDQLASEMFDIRDYIPDEPLREGGLEALRLDSGYRVDVLEPLERIRIRYEDASRQNSFDVTATAVMPPAVTSNGRHFEQAMRTEGRLVLRGRAHDVAGFHMRDRTWGETRLDAPHHAPPMYWSSPVFGDDFALNVTGVDDPARDPIWHGIYEFDRETAAAYNRGWVWRDGELHGLETSSIRTDWDRATGHPTSQTIDITDSGGREFQLTATITAACGWHYFSNMRVGICLARWECEGRIGWGECQTVAWTDFVHHLMGRPTDKERTT